MGMMGSHDSAHHRAQRSWRGWKLAHHTYRLFLLRSSPAAMSPIQSHTQSQDSATEQKGAQSGKGADPASWQLCDSEQDTLPFGTLLCCL